MEPATEVIEEQFQWIGRIYDSNEHNTDGNMETKPINLHNFNWVQPNSPLRTLSGQEFWSALRHQWPVKSLQSRSPKIAVKLIVVSCCQELFFLDLDEGNSVQRTCINVYKQSQSNSKRLNKNKFQEILSWSDSRRMQTTHQFSFSITSSMAWPWQAVKTTAI